MKFIPNTIIFILVVVAMTAFIIRQKNTIDRLKVEKREAIEYAKNDSSVVVWYRNKLNLEVSKVGVLNLSLSNTRQLLETERLNFVKTFDGVNKRLNNLEHASQTTLEAVGNFRMGLKDSTLRVDDSSMTVRKFDNNNGWFHISGYVARDTIIVHPQFNMTMQSVLYWKRKKILGLRIGRKEYFKETTSLNPFVHITRDEFITVGKRK